MAIAQSGDVARLLTERTGRRVEIVGVTTLGDVSKEHLTQIGGTGVFVSAVREALLRGEVDFAVHSLKDLPTGAAPGITLAAIPARDDPRDALVARDGAKLADLPAGARIGTGSPRRAAQLTLLRSDVTCVPIRGNANTRLAKVRDGELDAVVLAYAGLARIGHTDLVSEIFEPDDMVPGAGPGRARRRVPGRRRRAGRAAGRDRPPGHPRRGDGRAQPARRARGGVQCAVGAYAHRPPAGGRRRLRLRQSSWAPGGKFRSLALGLGAGWPQNGDTGTRRGGRGGRGPPRARAGGADAGARRGGPDARGETNGNDAHD